MMRADEEYVAAMSFLYSHTTPFRTTFLHFQLKLDVENNYQCILNAQRMQVVEADEGSVDADEI
jgi:hypothetical protein